MKKFNPPFRELYAKHGKWFVFLLFLACAHLTYAQETSGGLRGLVADSTGQPLAGATVVAIHIPSGTTYGTVTSPDGRYNLPGLRIGGPYSLTASYIGMTAFATTVNTIVLGEPLIYNIVLKENTIELNEVVVRGVRTGAQADVYGAGRNISHADVNSQPTVARSLQDMTRLVPQGSKDNSFLGSNFRYNNISIDGAINNDAIGFSPSVGGITGTSGAPGSSTRTNSISLDAIENIQVYLAPYDVKIGNFTGGSINAVTRSGTNTVEGSVYSYFRNAFLTGPNNTGDGSKLPGDFQDYQIGFRLGLPLIKDKLFWFTNEEITHRVDPIQLNAGDAAEAGVLTAQDAQDIQAAATKYGLDAGTAGQYNAVSKSNKFFNRIDWNINDKSQLVIRNNTIVSDAVNMERDQFDFRFGSIAYKQNNLQISTVAELKTRFTNRVSNSAIAGFTYIHDYRSPSSNADYPQIEIVGRTPGTTIFLGTDREASIFNQKQYTAEFTDNVSINLGKHNLTFGTHNELYHIDYGFVNSWNGRINYASIADFTSGDSSRIARVRGSYNFRNNSRDYLYDNPSSIFNINFLSVYAQDEIQISERFKVTPGVRFEYNYVPQKQALSPRTQNSPTDVNFGTTYTYTPINQIDQSYFSAIQISPRIGFRATLLEKNNLVLRGGVGLFTGRIPFAWLGYAFYNTGTTFGAFDRNQQNGSASLRGNPLQFITGNQGIAPYAAYNGEAVNSENGGKTQVDLIDNHFTMPKVFRGSLAVEYKTDNGYKFTAEGIYTKTIKDVLFQQLNLKDYPTYAPGYDLTLQRQPIYGGGNSNQGSVNSLFTNVYELSNTTQGYRYSITGQVEKTFFEQLSASVAYTFGHSEDISNGVRNSMESNWQLNQALVPNNPGLANSNFDIRHRIVAHVSYRITYHKNWATSIGLFVQAQSGSPFTYGFVNYNAQGTGQQVGLAYIPNRAEAINFFTNVSATESFTGQAMTAQQQADAFNAFINGNSYLSGRRGNFTERNEGRTPWNYQADVHLQQDFGIHAGRFGNMISVSLDIVNLTNLINKNWGIVYFSPNTYNSTASVGLVPFTPVRSSYYGNIYQFVNPGASYSIDPIASRWQMQIGLRYSF